MSPRRAKRLASTLLLGATAMLASVSAWSFSQGSPICEVMQLPLLEMSPVLAQPPPSGWRLQSNATVYTTETIRLQLSHPDPAKAVRGVLIWAKETAQTGSGQFQISNPERWQYIPSPATCGESALSHRDAQSKPQSELIFLWRPGKATNTIFRAFIVEDCNQPSCRSHQALTNILAMEKGLYRDSFEAPPR